MKRFFVALVGLALLHAGAGRASADQVLLLSTGDPTEDAEVVSLLQADGHNVTVGPAYYDYNGSSLSGYGAVILLQNNSDIGGNIPTSGQVALVNYVEGGGGLLTGEWTVWGIGAELYNQTLKNIIPVIPTGQYNSASTITYTQATPNAVLDNGLPSSFSFTADDAGGTETYFQPQPGATVFFGSSYGGTPPGDGIIGWEVGSGHVISFSTLAGTSELADPSYGRLFSNAVYWADGGHAAVPEPSGLALLGFGVVGLAAMARRRRRLPSRPTA